jgi:MIP family channel proteins
MRDSWRHFVAEFIGTFALTFVGGAAIMLAKDTNSPAGLLEIALAHGLILAVMVSALMRISGHFNPAVTIGFVAARRIEVPMAGVYIVAQVIGAIVAAYCLKWTFPFTLFEATRGGGQAVALQVSGGQAFLLEFIAPFFLVLVVFGTAVDPKAPNIGGLAIGLTVTADILAIGPLTGGSMNPARSFGPAVASGVFEAQLIYWAAPIAGGIVAAVLYDFLFLRCEIEPVSHGTLKPGATTQRE